MSYERLAGVLGIVVIALIVLGALVGLSGTGIDDGLLGSAWEEAAAATAVLTLVVLVAFAALGSPWGRMQRTTYW